jgi:hypothetical protein
LQIWHGYAKAEAMPTDRDQSLPPPANEAVPDPAGQPLPPAPQRALAEAAARRADLARKVANQPKEVAGRDGARPDPTRYGDWEINGLASDF